MAGDVSGHYLLPNRVLNQFNGWEIGEHLVQAAVLSIGVS